MLPNHVLFKENAAFPSFFKKDCSGCLRLLRFGHGGIDYDKLRLDIFILYFVNFRCNFLSLLSWSAITWSSSLRLSATGNGGRFQVIVARLLRSSEYILDFLYKPTIFCVFYCLLCFHSFFKQLLGFLLLLLGHLIESDIEPLVEILKTYVFGFGFLIQSFAVHFDSKVFIFFAFDHFERKHNLKKHIRVI